MPCYSPENVNAQRGEGVFDGSIRALQLLNSLGYGSEPELPLHLVYNPNGAFLPGPQAELPHFNTGAWSLYRPGVEDDLSYHQLVTGFLVQLCSMTKAPIYCRTADDFQLDLKMPAKLKLVTTRLKARRAANVYFTVSKISRVGITITRNGRTVFLTSASFAHGEHHFAVPRLKASGTYGVLLDATDLAGNYSQVSTPLHITH
jgi:hypothetical protein